MIRFFIITLILIIGISFLIPVFSKTDMDPCVYHPRLYPYYYQTNTDAAMVLMSANGYPEYLFEVPLLINRPLPPAVVSGIRRAIVGPLLSIFLPREARGLMWGRWSAADSLTSYTLWIIMNIFCVAASAFMLYRVCSVFFNRNVSYSAAVMLLTTPIVIFSLRELHYTAFALMIITGSLYFWLEVRKHQDSLCTVILLSFLMGFLFLGKLAVSTFLCGCLLYLLFAKKKVMIVPIIVFSSLPTILWMTLIGITGQSYSAPETRFLAWVGEGSSILFYISKTGRYFLDQWIPSLWENTGILHIPFAVIGIREIRRDKKRKLLPGFVLFALVDFLFYLLIHRTHAIYGLHTMVFYFVVTARGIVWFAGYLQRMFPKWIPENPIVTSISILVLIQAQINFLQLPLYGG